MFCSICSHDSCYVFVQVTVTASLMMMEKTLGCEDSSACLSSTDTLILYFNIWSVNHE